MKKYIYRLFIAFVATATLVSCADNEGTTPGNDSNPSIIVYKYTPGRPYNVDNDVIIRFAVNNKASEAYYLTEKTAEKASRIASSGENAYMDYVVSKGVKLTVSSEMTADVTLTDLFGDYTITAVAVNGGTKTSAETTFSGLDWTDVAKGTYYFSVANFISSTGLRSNPTVLQICTTNSNLYRFKDVYGAGYSLKINLINYKGRDEDGEYQFFRVPPMELPFIYGNYGNLNVRDIGYWQGSDAWVISNGYESGMYTDYNCFVYVQYYVAAGNVGYNYDFFEVD